MRENLQDVVGFFYTAKFDEEGRFEEYELVLNSNNVRITGASSFTLSMVGLVAGVIML